ncbi:aminoglycoside N(3)-acetyltransferase [Hoeflea sp. TYP-13]|uniref:aminoglycoside N(3)-acetyltransferase n=1 Tax=Hoeflea sp. TYP-13 TaxID=3230023 RepID=UPI0034C694C4
MHRRAKLRDQLNRLGLGKCGLVMVHASMRRVGPTQGGASGLLDVLQESLGPDGTLVMPMGADDSQPIDCRTTPADKELGVLAEVFRQRNGTQVNDHAAARFGAAGPQAADILEPIPLHHYYGQGSPLSRFAASNGWVLRLGADIDTVTLTHWAEYLADVPEKRHVRRRYVRAGTGPQWIESLDDVDGIADWPEGDYFSQILIDFLAGEGARTGAVGDCQAELFSANDFVPFAVRWMEERLGK